MLFLVSRLDMKLLVLPDDGAGCRIAVSVSVCFRNYVALARYFLLSSTIFKTYSLDMYVACSIILVWEFLLASRIFDLDLVFWAV